MNKTEKALEKKDIEEAMKSILLIFPNAKITVSDETDFYGRGNWIIDTGVKEPDYLDPSFAGTPAEEQYNDYESNYGNSLIRWRDKSGSHESLFLTATEFNEDQKASRTPDKEDKGESYEIVKKYFTDRGEERSFKILYEDGSDATKAEIYAAHKIEKEMLHNFRNRR